MIKTDNTLIMTIHYIDNFFFQIWHSKSFLLSILFLYVFFLHFFFTTLLPSINIDKNLKRINSKVKIQNL